jgi:hypothetical protein
VRSQAQATPGQAAGNMEDAFIGIVTQARTQAKQPAAQAVPA